MAKPEFVAPAIPPGSLPQVDDKQLAQFAELIYARTGIRVSPQKKTLLSNRVRRRLKRTGIEDFGEYYQHLQGLRPNDPEWDLFLHEITTRETCLFRDETQWDWFRDTFLPQCASEARTGKKRQSLRIWSAACSTGDEVVTVACCITACLPDFSQWNIEILGTDIGVGALEQAKSGIYGERAMRLVPETYRQRFFTKARDVRIWQARPVLAAMIRYRQHNLLHPLRERPFDLVLLKNVMIYFDAASKRTVMANVRDAVCSGGWLIAGAAEGVADLLKDFQRTQRWLYRKPSR